LLPAARAADETKPVEKSEKKELRVLSAPEREPSRLGRGAIVRHLSTGEKENVTFLGVETGPVPAALAAQLGLPDGHGLVVNHVVPDSPAAGALKQHDILLKFDDQILIEQRQLSVLVRNRKEGDEVTLTYLRGGKQATARIRLAKHEVPKVSAWEAPLTVRNAPHGFAFGSGGGEGNFDFQIMPGPGQPRTSEEIDRFLGLMNNGAARPGVQLFRQTMPGDRSMSVTINTGNSRVVLDDEKGTLELAIKDGSKELVAKNSKGGQVFSGPVNTPEERKALPPGVRARLERLEDSAQFRFKTDGDFKGTETKLFRPRGQGIVLPRQSPPDRQSATLFL
jgi:hypothetical protein